MLDNFRIYGKPPFAVVLVHGGPGAPGEMKPVAKNLSKNFSVIEPLQTKNSIDGQVEELKLVIERETTHPVYLIGWSWGAWLSYLLAAHYPNLVKKLILVSSGPFEASYAERIMKTRLKRLSTPEQKRVNKIIQLLQTGKANDIIFNEFGNLMNKADSYNPLSHQGRGDIEKSNFQSEIYEKVWSEADALRNSGKLLKSGIKITCPVVAIHGDFDPHPSAGVKKPLSAILKNFRFYLLKQCGHHPWFEKEAKDKFYEILFQELKS
ncbi:MAG: alpha/beta hydrolase [Candidatus Shapirobacteria bacterium]|jgi:pimeloyl-ACP methyl ester carboxylesterase